MKGKLLVIICLINIVYCNAQQTYSSSFTILSDNDLYTSISRDRYYTNGLFLNYSYASNQENEKLEKKIHSLEIGQKMYTPFKANVPFASLHDRPFAAYLYGSYGFKNYYKDNKVLDVSCQVGVIGPSALGEEFMKIVHSLYGFDAATGWLYQIKEAFGFNLQGKFIQPLTKNDAVFDLNWKSEVSLGTVFTDFSTGFLARIGLKPLLQNSKSVLNGGNIHKKGSKNLTTRETFFYINPAIRYAAYDATIQGSFLNKNSPITYELKPFVFTTEIGFWHTVNRYNFRYAFHYHTKKIENDAVDNTNTYGSIQINYLFN